MRWRGPRSTVVAAVTVLAVLAVLVIGYRVLAPAEVLTPARTAYSDIPTAPARQPRVIGTLNAAPLIVDGRLRVYASARQIRAEEPVDARVERTPYWSYRRWPAQVSAVVAAGTTVLSRWSDGELVALDARTGRVVWRASGPRPEQGYTGRRTGAETVYSPTDLLTANTSDGRAVLLLTGGALRGYELTTGRLLWQAPDTSGCRADAFTGATGQLITVDTCADRRMIEFREVATGTVIRRWRPPDAPADLVVTPVGCALGRSSCPAMRTGAIGQGRSWLIAPAGTGTGPAEASPDRPAHGPVPAPALDVPGSVLADRIVLAVEGTRLVARSVTSGVELWQRDLSRVFRVVASQPGQVHLLTERHELITINPATGTRRSLVRLFYGRDPRTWVAGYVYAANGLVAVERLTPPVRPDADDQRYYATTHPVIIAAT